jgi:hypothetical protein
MGPSLERSPEAAVGIGKFLTALIPSQLVHTEEEGKYEIAYWLRHYVTGRKVMRSSPDKDNKSFF